jgi:tyrosine-protein kinase Etk/Wzc
MAITKGFHLFDLAQFAVRRKELLVLVFLTALVTSYAAVFFGLGVEFEATALIIPRQDETSNLASSVLRGMKNMPLNLGTTTPNAQIDMYKTIVYSRTMMESVIKKFDLIAVYGLSPSDIACMEKAIKRLAKEISTKETEESAFRISVRSNTRQRAADMTNFIVTAMNKRIIDLQISRSRENRIFLENRVHDLRNQIRSDEDSLREYQERTGLLDVKTQLLGILTTHASLEKEFAGKQLQLDVMKRLYAKNAPQIRELEIQVQEYDKKLKELRLEGDPGSPLLPLKDLPATSVGFVRRYREVEIDNLLLEYVMPLYEQAKVEEKKDYPILQVIDYAVPPATKAFPPRVLFAFIGACGLTLLVFVLLRLRDTLPSTLDPKWFVLLNEIKRWDWNERLKKS